MSGVMRCPQAPKIRQVLELADQLGVTVWCDGWQDLCCHWEDLNRCTARTQKGRGPRCRNRILGSDNWYGGGGHAHGSAGSGDYVWVTAAEAADMAHGTCWIHS